MAVNKLLRVQTFLLLHLPRCLFIIVPVLLYSCHQTNYSTDYHPQYFDPVFKKIDSLKFHHHSDAECLAILDSAYKKYPYTGIGDLYRKYDLKKEWALADGLNYIKANEYADSMLLILQDKTTNKRYMVQYGLALLYKGDALLELKRYDDAVTCYYKGRQLMQQIPDSCYFTSRYSGQMGTVYYRQEKYAEAINAYQQALHELEDCHPSNGFEKFWYQQGMLNNIALSYSESSQPDSAILYYNKDLAFIQQYEKSYPETFRFLNSARGLIYGNLGYVYYEKGDYQHAEQLFLQEIAINTQKGYYNQSAQNTQSILAGLYILKTGAYDKGRAVLQQLKASLDTLPNDYAEREWRKLQWKYFDKTGQIKEAYAAMQHYMTLRDSVNENNRKLAGIDMDKEFKSLQQQYEIDLLKKENQLRTTSLLISIGFSVLAMVIILLIWQNWRRSRKNIVQLTSLNTQINFQNIQLEQMLDALKKSNKDKDHILKIVAHDLKNPVGAIASITSMLLEENGHSRSHHRMLEMIKAASSNSVEMINELMIAPIDNQHAEIKKVPVDMQDLLQHCVSLLRFKADEKKQFIILHADEPCTLLANRENIWRVINNLIVNAIKFSPVGATITVSMAFKRDLVQITVKDTGIGIPEELRDKVFDIFTHAKRFGTSGEKPFGLGLSIAKQLTELHGGRIWFHSEPEKGTEFFVEFPRSSLFLMQ